MGADCCDHSTLPDSHRGNPAFRPVLRAVLGINPVTVPVVRAVVGNRGVVLAGGGVLGGGRGGPDINGAANMAGLALQGAGIVVRQALSELRQPLPISA